MAVSDESAMKKGNYVHSRSQKPETEERFYCRAVRKRWGSSSQHRSILCFTNGSWEIHKAGEDRGKEPAPGERDVGKVNTEQEMCQLPSSKWANSKSLNLKYFLQLEGEMMRCVMEKSLNRNKENFHVIQQRLRNWNVEVQPWMEESCTVVSKGTLGLLRNAEDI